MDVSADQLDHSKTDYFLTADGWMERNKKPRTRTAAVVPDDAIGFRDFLEQHFVHPLQALRQRIATSRKMDVDPDSDPSVSVRPVTLMDVAGGKGDLAVAFILNKLRDFQMFLVDPRPATGDFSKPQRKYLRKQAGILMESLPFPMLPMREYFRILRVQ